MTNPCCLVLARSDEIGPIRTELDICDLASMCVIYRIDLCARLYVVLGNFARLVAGENEIRQRSKKGDGSFGTGDDDFFY